MSFCVNCESKCFDPTNDRCVTWTGRSVPEIGIISGNRYDTEIIKLVDYVVEFIETQVDTGCLSDVEQSDIPTSIRMIIDYLCDLTTDSIKSVGNLSCLGNLSSQTAAALAGQKMQVSTSPTATGASLNYNLSEITSNLPIGYEVSTIDVKISGSKQYGKTMIVNTDKNAGSIALLNTRYPINAVFEVVVNTPKGTVVLSNQEFFDNPSNSSSSNPLMKVMDFTTNGGIATQTDVNEQFASELCSLKSEVEDLQELNISGCDDVVYADNSVSAVVGVHSMHICEILDDLKHIPQKIVTFTACDDACEASVIDQTIQEAFDRLSQTVCSLLARVNQLETKVQDMEIKLDECCLAALTG